MDAWMDGRVVGRVGVWLSRWAYKQTDRHRQTTANIQILYTDIMYIRYLNYKLFKH